MLPFSVHQRFRPLSPTIGKHASSDNALDANALSLEPTANERPGARRRHRQVYVIGPNIARVQQPTLRLTFIDQRGVHNRSLPTRQVYDVSGQF
jgi:hypothetical protein